MNEILIYYPLYDFYIQDLMKELDAVDSDFTVRMSSPGGEIFPSWGVAKKIRELSEAGFKSTLKIDGMAASMAGILAPFFDNVEAIDKAKLMIHAPWGGDIKMLKELAKDLSSVLKSRIDGDKFKELTGSTIDEVMNPEAEEPKEVWLSAKQAKDLGLIDKVVKLTPAVKNEIESKMKAFYGNATEPQNKYNHKSNNVESKFKKMDLNTLKTEHPALYNEVLIQGKNAGIEEERIRVNSWLPYVAFDKEKALDGIKNAKTITSDVREEMFVASQLQARTVKDENAAPVVPAPDPAKDLDEALKEDIANLKNQF